jgi:hypothetical protein
VIGEPPLPEVVAVAFEVVFEVEVLLTGADHVMVAVVMGALSCTDATDSCTSVGTPGLPAISVGPEVEVEVKVVFPYPIAFFALTRT